MILAGQGGDGGQRIAEQALFQEAAELAQQGEQAHPLAGRDGTGAAARLDGQRVRPAASQETHQFEEIGASRQHLGRCLAPHGGEAPCHRRMPGPAGIRRAGEIRHEEQVEVRQVVGQVFRGLDQVPGELAVRWRGQAHRLGQRRGGSGRLRDRADAADARHDGQRVERGTSQQDLFEPTKQRRIDIGGLHPAIGQVETEFKVTFDAVERPEDDARHLLVPFLRTAGSTTG